MNVLSPQWMLLAGIVLSILVQGSSYQDTAKRWSTKLLQISVVLLGASLNFNSVIHQGTSGVLVTFLSIIFVFMLGYIGRKALRVNYEQGVLITMGTAICGGSAIGALSPVIKAESFSIAVSMAIVFLLNALAVFIFPPLGTTFNLSQEQFGLWSALAIHDTSSVVAASSIYGSKALEVATTVKLIRALWIVPITLMFGFYSEKSETRKLSVPWFIFGFIGFSLFFTFMKIPTINVTFVKDLSKLGFSLTLFLIGLSFDFKKIKTVGLRPLLLGLGLWIIVSVSSLCLIKSFY